ncbi:sugar phosphate isomerase/epimerase family protein [Piscinibacter sakaiensis]|uniref:sugar phosphate isomerase/epimerase family protein n=1 Tax=Piscinibacter sakaiensis TaxID=1547922 RepID=UPI003AAF8149
MTNPPPLLISLGAFGASEVRRHGQAWFTKLAADAGADGVEVRGELASGSDAEIAAIRDTAASASLQLVYSSPQGLWADDGRFDAAAFADALALARRHGAARLKMSIGGFSAESVAGLIELRERLADSEIELLIENDQTTAAGSLPALQRFFAAASDNGLELPMTFDLGNWHWIGECPLQAARALGSRVAYVHCKGVQRQPQRWVAVPLVDSAAPWRAMLRELPAGQPWAIEYPLVGEDLLATTRGQLELLRGIARSLR